MISKKNKLDTKTLQLLIEDDGIYSHHKLYIYQMETGTYVTKTLQFSGIDYASKGHTYHGNHVILFISLLDKLR